MTTPAAAAAPGPLTGLRVLDLSRVLAGPSATQILGDLGADVIKIERPGLGDEGRQYGPVYIRDAEGNRTAESALYIAGNRNKRSLTLNIAHPRGQQVIRDLVKTCDVLVENFKVGALAKYGLDYASLKAVNPRLIYCSITGNGTTGAAPARGITGGAMRGATAAARGGPLTRPAVFAMALLTTSSISLDAASNPRFKVSP